MSEDPTNMSTENPNWNDPSLWDKVPEHKETGLSQSEYQPMTESEIRASQQRIQIDQNTPRSEAPQSGNNNANDDNVVEGVYEEIQDDEPASVNTTQSTSPTNEGPRFAPGNLADIEAEALRQQAAQQNQPPVENRNQTEWVDRQPPILPGIDETPAQAEAAGVNLEAQKAWADTLEHELDRIDTLPFQAVRVKLAKLNAGAPRAFVAAGRSPGQVEGDLYVALTQRLNTLINTAREEALLTDVDTKKANLEADYAAMKSDFDAGRLTTKDPRLNPFKAAVNGLRLDPIGMDETPELTGIRNYVLADVQQDYRERIDNLIRDTKQSELDRGIIGEPNEFLLGVDMIDITTPEGVRKQYEQVRKVLTIIETTTGSVKSSKEVRALMEYVELREDKPDKKKLHPDIEKEVRASIHLKETHYVLRETFNFGADSIKDAMAGTVKSLKGDGMFLTVDDLETIEIHGYKDHCIQQAEDALRRVASMVDGVPVTVDGQEVLVKYQAKMDVKTQAALRTTLIAQIAIENNVSQEVATRSYDLALLAFTAKFEDMPYDTEANHPISEAIYFGTHLKKKNPAFYEKEGGIDVVTLGTSFDRQLRKFAKPGEAVFQHELDEVIRGNDPDRADAAWWFKAQGAPIEFTGASYVEGVDRKAYETYLTSYLPAMLDAKKAFMDASSGTVSRSEMNGRVKKELETVRKVDPYGMQNLRGRLLRWYIRSGQPNASLDYDYSQTAGILSNLERIGALDKDPKLAAETKAWVMRYANVRSGGMGVKGMQALEGLKQIIR